MILDELVVLYLDLHDPKSLVYFNHWYHQNSNLRPDETPEIVVFYRVKIFPIKWTPIIRADITPGFDPINFYNNVKRDLAPADEAMVVLVWGHGKREIPPIYGLQRVPTTIQEFTKAINHWREHCDLSLSQNLDKDFRLYLYQKGEDGVYYRFGEKDDLVSSKDTLMIFYDYIALIRAGEKNFGKSCKTDNIR